MRIVTSIAHSILNSVGFEVRRLRSGNSNCPTIQPWLEDDEVRAMLDRPRRYSIVTPDRMFMLLQWLDFALAADGEVAEFGVWRGGTALLLHDRLTSRAPERTLHLFDSFAGLPQENPARDNYHRRGDLSDSSEIDVRSLFEGRRRVLIHAGSFEETVAEVRAQQFCFAHIDADLYDSVLFASEFIFPRLSPGGVVVYDDYGFRTCAGAKTAVDEYFSAMAVRPIYLTTGQCVAIKTTLPIDARNFKSHVA
jgi:O-methyltransferase